METAPDINQPSKALPGGTVTFLFTDIEGSTQLIHKLGDQYSQVLALQRQVLRSAFEQWRGSEVDTQGDAFFVAFTRASDAISAAAQAQESLAHQSWPGGVDVRVRMGLHTGEARLTQEGYVGMDVHRASRICSAGHGGQTLLSPSTAILVMNNLPENLRLRDLGEHRLKDLGFPEHLYQLDVPGLACDFPALKSLNAMPNNLPVQLTSFVGRQDEIEQLKKLLVEVRLVTITGPGGSGKSRLSLQAAADLIEQFSDGVWFVPLSTVDSVDEVPIAIANSLHFRIENVSSSEKPAIRLADYLSNRSMLLVLDNFEHLLPGAGLLKDILVRASQVKFMLTSRESLNIPEEWVFAIPGLSYPRNGHKDGNGTYTALALFQERARQSNPTFNISPTERPYVATICRLVGGMPLAIELAAPWTAVLSCREIAQEIEHNLDFLSDTLRGMPEGHRSIRAVFEHSWNLLNQAERNAFCNLAVFEGGFDRTAAEQVTRVNLSMLLNLTNKSLVQRGEGERFQLHTLLHQFASERLHTRPVHETKLRDSHSRYFLNLLEQWETSGLGDDWLLVLEKMLLENGNFWEMIRWVLIHWDEAKARQVLDSLGPIYLAQGFHQGSRAYQSIITYLNQNGINLDTETPRKSLLLNAMVFKSAYDALLGDPGTEAVAKRCLNILRNLDLEYELGVCLYALGILAVNSSNYHQAIEWFEEARPLLKNKGNPETSAGNFILLGWAYHELGDYGKAKSFYTQAYEISMRQGVGVHVPYAVDKLGLWADAIGDSQQGLQYHMEALKVHKILGALSGQAYALSRMSVSAWHLGDYAKALQYGMEGDECFKSIGHRWGMAISQSRIGYAELGLKEYAEARQHFLQGLRLGQEYQMPGPMIYAVLGLAMLEARTGSDERAIEMLTIVINTPNTPSTYLALAKSELASLAEKLSRERYAAAQERGQVTDPLALVDLLLNSK